MLDTNLLSASREPRRPVVSAWLATLGGASCVSAVTIAELQFGAASVAARRPAFAAELEIWLDGILARSRVVPLNAEAARLLGRMQSHRALGHLAQEPATEPRFGSDLAIAATAITAGVSLATLNVRHFRLIARHFPALVVVDPLTAD